jgi:hypothetical protein
MNMGIIILKVGARVPTLLLKNESGRMERSDL